MKNITCSMLIGASLLLSTSLITPAVAAGEATDLSSFFKDGSVGLNLRYRYEAVDQDGFALDATAATLRTKLTYKTATWGGFSGFLEFENSVVAGSGQYNSTVNGKAQYPVIADPEHTELNQAYLAYKGDMFGFKVGRQGVNLDDLRFIGTVGWRQNDQTLDSATVSVTPTEGLNASYTYVWNVNRIFGRDHPAGDFDSNSHLINASYKLGAYGKLTAYGYLLDFDNAGLSSATYGARFAGASKVSESVKLGYTLEYAQQSDYGDNPADYSAPFMHFGTSVSVAGFTFGADYELLGSDGGAVSFKTPLATLHKFNGWADKFLATPAAGLEDLYFTAAYKVPGKTGLGGLLIKGIYHDFKSDDGGLDYGSEIDVLVSKKLTSYLTASVKAAFYNADSFATDTDKIWVTLMAKF